MSSQSTEMEHVTLKAVSWLTQHQETVGQLPGFLSAWSWPARMLYRFEGCEHLPYGTTTEEITCKLAGKPRRVLIEWEKSSINALRIWETESGEPKLLLEIEHDLRLGKDEDPGEEEETLKITVNLDGQTSERVYLNVNQDWMTLECLQAWLGKEGGSTDDRAISPREFILRKDPSRKIKIDKDEKKILNQYLGFPAGRKKTEDNEPRLIEHQDLMNLAKALGIEPLPIPATTCTYVINCQKADIKNARGMLFLSPEKSDPTGWFLIVEDPETKEIHYLRPVIPTADFLDSTEIQQFQSKPPSDLSITWSWE